MSRSVFGAVCLEYSDKSEDAERVLAENGFKEVPGDYEYVYVKENPETKFATYLKYDYMTNVFLVSVWLQDMTDESCRERCIEALESYTEEVKDARNIIRSLLDLFEGKFKKTECYIYESDVSEQMRYDQWTVD